MEKEFSYEEKVIILTFYKNCKDMQLKLVLNKLLLNEGILKKKNSIYSNCYLKSIE